MAPGRSRRHGGGADNNDSGKRYFDEHFHLRVLVVAWTLLLGLNLLLLLWLPDEFARSQAVARTHARVTDACGSAGVGDPQ
jgi:hypothetical protein